MRVLLDACVLVPTLTRALMMHLATSGQMTPLWSPMILSEWMHAAKRTGPVQAMGVEGEIAVMKARFPNSLVTPAADLTDSLYLPDPDDTHVLAAAITGKADHLVTFNAKDFPTRTMAAHGIPRTSPDALLLLLGTDPAAEPGLRTEIAKAQNATGLPARTLLKKSHLPRFAKALFPKA